MRWRLAHALLLVLIQGAAATVAVRAQPRRIDFESWTNECIASDTCPETTISVSGAVLDLVSDCDNGTGACIVADYADSFDDYRLHPEPIPWHPDPAGLRLAVSLYFRLGPEHSERPTPLGAFAELIRTYTNDDGQNILLEYDASDGPPRLEWQLEGGEDDLAAVPCTLPVMADADWHLVEASIVIGSAPGDIDRCEITLDRGDSASSESADMWSLDTGRVGPMGEVVVGGGGGSYEMVATTVSIDEVCLGVLPEDCDGGGMPGTDGGTPDVGVPDGGPPDTSVATDTGREPGDEPAFRGGGGCACRAMGGPGESPGTIGLVLLVVALSRPRRRV